MELLWGACLASMMCDKLRYRVFIVGIEFRFWASKDDFTREEGKEKKKYQGIMFSSL